MSIPIMPTNMSAPDDVALCRRLKNSLYPQCVAISNPIEPIVKDTALYG